MPTFNPIINPIINTNLTTNHIIYSPKVIDNQPIIEKNTPNVYHPIIDGKNITETKKAVYKPNIIQQNIDLSLEQRGVKELISSIPKYYYPIITNKGEDFVSDPNWTDHPSKMAVYQNGLPVYCAIKFNKLDSNNNEYIDPNSDNFDELKKLYLQDLYLDKCIIKVKQKKNIISTPIIGRDYEVKEYIGLRDYDIQIDGTIATFLNGVYPIDDVKMLRTYLTLPVPIFVTCPFLNELFGIDHIVINDFNFPQNEGGISYQKFSINAINDDITDSDIILNTYNTDKIK